MSENNSVVVATNNSVAAGGYNAGAILTDAELVAAEAFLKRFISTEKGGIKTVADGIALITRAKDLNIPFTSAIEHVHVINGKTGVDVHVLKALLLRAGVTYRKVKDYAPLYEYTDGYNVYKETQLPIYCVICRNEQDAEKVSSAPDDKIGVYPLRYYVDLKGAYYNQFQISDKCKICINSVQAKAVAAKGEFPIIRVPAQPYDYITEYEFTRRQMIYGEVVVTHAVGKFTYTEAVSAGMFDKDTYKKYPKVMISHRAFTYGAREIADDVCLGLMETTELKQINNIPISDSDVVEIE